MAPTTQAEIESPAPAAPAGDDALSIRRPVQQRSQATLDRIEAASFALLGAGGWDAVTVNAIARETGLSRGAVYARFPSRAGLLAFIRERYYTALSLAERKAFAEVDASASGSLAVIARDAVGAVASVVEQFGPVMVSLRADADARETSGAARSILFDRYSRALLGGSRDITHDEPTFAVGFTFRVVFETLAFSVSDPDSVPPPLRREPEQVVEELAAMVVAYLTTAPAAAATSATTPSSTSRTTSKETP